MRSLGEMPLRHDMPGYVTPEQTLAVHVIAQACEDLAEPATRSVRIACLDRPGVTQLCPIPHLALAWLNSGNPQGLTFDLYWGAIGASPVYIRTLAAQALPDVVTASGPDPLLSVAQAQTPARAVAA